MHMFFGAENPNFRSVFKPEVELMLFLRMRSIKIAKKNAENVYSTVGISGGLRRF